MPDKCQGRYLAVCNEKVITDRNKKDGRLFGE